MSVSGLVVSITDEGAAQRVEARIAAEGSFTLGARIGLRFPVVAEAVDGPTAERQHEWLRQLPGVVKVDVAFVYLDPDEEPARAC
jgi:hypothetical protein